MNIINNISIMPTYKCNFDCEYCYLGELTKNKKILDLNILNERLSEIEKKYIIETVTIYGGEISLLDKKYLDDLYSLTKDYDPLLVTNLSNEWIIEYSLNKNLNVSISLNEERPHYKQTLEKIYKYKNLKNLSLSVVVLPSLLKRDVKELLEFYESIGLEIMFIQYHPSIYSHKKYNISTKDYIDFLINILNEKHKNKYNITICNEIILNDIKYSPTANNFIFINPDGNYSSIKYDNNEIESPIIFNTLQEWENFCNNEFEWYKENCNSCKYFKKCKAEHLINLKPGNCSGLYNLLEFYNKLGI